MLIFERYDALAIFDEVLGALAPAQRLTERSAWRETVKADPACLEEALESWLTGPLDASPILLIVDDLERILETPTPTDTEAAVMVTAEYRAAIGAVLLAFAQAQTASRLLLTSRYDVRHPDGAGGDLAAALVRIPLAPMPERERLKQLRAAERVAGREDGATGEAVQELLSRALAAAAGNPGLQAILTRPVLAGELEAAEEALTQIGGLSREWRAAGGDPGADRGRGGEGFGERADRVLCARVVCDLSRGADRRSGTPACGGNAVCRRGSDPARGAGGGRCGAGGGGCRGCGPAVARAWTVRRLR